MYCLFAFIVLLFLTGNENITECTSVRCQIMDNNHTCATAEKATLLSTQCDRPPQRALVIVVQLKANVAGNLNRNQ